MRGREHHRFGAIFLFDVQHVFSNNIKSLVPRCFAEQAFSAIAHPHERRQYSVRIICCHQAGLAAWAELSFGMGMIGIAFQFDYATVFDFGKYTAAPDTHLAHGCNVSVTTGVQLSIFPGSLAPQEAE